MRRALIGSVLFALFVISQTHPYTALTNQKLLFARVGFWPNGYFLSRYTATNRSPLKGKLATNLITFLPCPAGNQRVIIPIVWDVLGMPDIPFPDNWYGESLEDTYRTWHDAFLDYQSQEGYMPETSNFPGAGMSAATVEVTYMCGESVYQMNYELAWNDKGQLVEANSRLPAENFGTWTEYINRPPAVES